jgi:hypothetical protein
MLAANVTCEKPVLVVASGPAGGVIGAARLGVARNDRDVIVFDKQISGEAHHSLTIPMGPCAGFCRYASHHYQRSAPGLDRASFQPRQFVLVAGGDFVCVVLDPRS